MEKKSKGKEQPEKKIIFGRPKNGLKMGIVGLPNVGKSTTFNLLSKQSIPAENYMFCTINPNQAKVEVPDERFKKLVESYEPKKSFSATLNVVDIAGLVKGAAEGAGMGNAFLSNISSVDGIYHVVRGFDDEEIQHYDGEVDPVRDLETIKGELITKDLSMAEKKYEEASAKFKRNGQDKFSKFEAETLEKVIELLKDNKNVKDKNDWTYKEIDLLNDYLFFTSKPGVYLVNLSKKDYIRKKNKYLSKIVKWVEENGGGKIIPYSAVYETELFKASADDRKKIIEETKADSALGKIITTGFQELELIYYFTAGEDEVKCWTVRKGSKAPQAAGVIHSDFERGFISAEVMKYEDFENLGGEAEVKKEGKVRTEGKNYEVQDGDIIYFKFNVSDPKKKK